MILTHVLDCSTDLIRKFTTLILEHVFPYGSWAPWFNDLEHIASKKVTSRAWRGPAYGMVELKTMKTTYSVVLTYLQNHVWLDQNIYILPIKFNDNRLYRKKPCFFGNTRFLNIYGKKPGFHISTQKKVGSWRHRYIYIIPSAYY